MNLLIGSMTIGLLLALLALGVYISFRILGQADMTADGSFTLGGAVAGILLVKGVNPYMATLAALGAGALAGGVTGLLQTRFRVQGLLAGILVMTGLYSVCLRVMGRSNLPLLTEHTLSSVAAAVGFSWFGVPDAVIQGWVIPARDLAMLLFAAVAVGAVAILLYLFLRTHVGLALRATGDNPQMIRALGVDTANMTLIGLTLSNAIIALSGALMAQYQGFADVQMGIGMIVWGLASVIIGEGLVRTRHIGLAICGTIMGSVLFRLLVAIALRFGLNPNDLKLVTATFVFLALFLPYLAGKVRIRRRSAHHA